jgi:uncharacterized protein with PhoU and TrkA domain
MNTGSRDERQMLTDINRIAQALERIADAAEALADRPLSPARAERVAEQAVEHLRGEG